MGVECRDMSEETPLVESPIPSAPPAAGVPDINSDAMADIIRKRKPNEKSCKILLDPTIKHEIEQLETELNQAVAKTVREGRRGKALSSSSSQEVDRLEEALADAYDRLEAAHQEFIFRDIGNRRYDEGLNDPDNRPTAEQIKVWKDAGMEKEQGPLQYHTENFPAWLISECSYSPKISRTQARVIVDDWSEGDTQLMFLTAIAACKERTSIPFGRRDFAKIPDFDSKSLSAVMPESPIPSSSDGEKTTD